MKFQLMRSPDECKNYCTRFRGEIPSDISWPPLSAAGLRTSRRAPAGRSRSSGRLRSCRRHSTAPALQCALRTAENDAAVSCSISPHGQGRADGG